MTYYLICIFWCVGKDDGKIFNQNCKEAYHLHVSYSVFSMLAMLLYFLRVIDLAVLTTKISSYVLECIRMLSEVCLLILTLVSTLHAFANGINILEHKQTLCHSIPKSLLTLMQITTKMYGSVLCETYEKDELVLEQ